MSKIAIVVAKFNPLLTQGLCEGAQTELLSQGVSRDDIDVFWVPGAFEIPIVAKHVVATGKYLGVVCLGVVIRGETAHFDYVCTEACRGVNQLALETGVVHALGILTTENRQQAQDRVFGRKGNKGAEAAQALMETLAVVEAL